MDALHRFEAIEAAKAARWRALADSGIENVPDWAEHLADRHGDRVCFEEVDSGRTATWREVDARANAIAARARDAGLAPGDRAALMMENRWEFFATTLGLAKAGVATALLNTSLSGELLRAAVEVAEPKRIIASPRYCDTLRAALGAGAHVVSIPGEGASAARPTRALRARLTWRSPFVFIYTSGTTGRSKAACFSHKRFVGAGINWAEHAQLEEGVRYYVPLPLYHGNGGVVALASTLLCGGTAVLRERFSARHFWDDVRAHRCTATIYIGELWRYLANTHPDPVESPLTTAMGNGLAADLWPVVAGRFGVRRIVEHYGSTEMPADAIVNSYGRAGSCGFLPPGHPGYVLVRHEVATGEIARGDDGLARTCALDEPGELLLALDGGTYDGYLDPSATAAKLCSNVIAPGDVWWRSGDLLRRDAEGFFTFVDRLGDTFRWNGENASTSEVEQALIACPSILQANAYGVPVPGRDGKACMASIQVSPGFDWDELAELVEALPRHARPRFVRASAEESPTTTTFKLKKHELASAGFAPGGEGDLRYLEPNTSRYVPLTPEVVERIRGGLLRI